jgi:acyl carrier protein phosphodiesterase
MNFLGHIFLSGKEDEIILGNFIADHIKGRIQLEYPQRVIKGIQLHRAIDYFTDHHPMVIRGVRRLNVDYGHYGTVIIDMYYDHFLSSLWSDYHPEPIIPYTQSIYAQLLPFLETMPARTQSMLPYMIRDNWLAGYARADGLNRALNGMAKRAKFVSGMENATAFLINNYEAFKEEFRAFMPDMIEYADEWKREHQVL